MARCANAAVCKRSYSDRCAETVSATAAAAAASACGDSGRSHAAAWRRSNGLRRLSKRASLAFFVVANCRQLASESSLALGSEYCNDNWASCKRSQCWQ